MEDLTKVSNELEIPQANIHLVSNNSGYALDDQNELFYLLFEVNSNNAWMPSFSYDSLINAEVRDTHSDSGSARKIGRAVVGDVLFGDVGAIVGAVSTSELFNVDLIITTNSRNHPTHVYSLCSFEKQGSITYTSAHHFGEQIAAAINNIVACYQSSSITAGAPNIDPNHIDATITRIKLFLEDKEWQKARTYCDGALDYAPDNSMLYLLRCCANEHQSNVHDLIVYSDLDHNNLDYIKANRFADADLSETLDKLAHERKCEDTYNKATFELSNGNQLLQESNITGAADSFIKAMQYSQSIQSYKNADSILASCKEKIYNIASNKERNKTIDTVHLAKTCLNELGDYKDSAQLQVYYNELNKHFHTIITNANSLLKKDWTLYTNTEELTKSRNLCISIEAQEKAKELQDYINNVKERDRKYNESTKLLKSNKIKDVAKAKDFFQKNPDYNRSKALLSSAEANIKTLERNQVRKRRIGIIVVIIIFILTTVYLYVTKHMIPEQTYQNGLSYYNNGHYKKTISTLSKIDNYKNAKTYINNAKEKLKLNKDKKAMEDFIDRFDSGSISFDDSSSYADDYLSRLESDINKKQKVTLSNISITSEVMKNLELESITLPTFADEEGTPANIPILDDYNSAMEGDDYSILKTNSIGKPYYKYLKPYMQKYDKKTWKGRVTSRKGYGTPGIDYEAYNFKIITFVGCDYKENTNDLTTDNIQPVLAVLYFEWADYGKKSDQDPFKDPYYLDYGDYVDSNDIYSMAGYSNIDKNECNIYGWNNYKGKVKFDGKNAIVTLFDKDDGNEVIHLTQYK